MEQSNELQQTKYRIINMGDKPQYFYWSLNLLEDDVLQEFKNWQQTEEYKGLEPAERAINRRKPLTERILEFMNRKYNMEGYTHPNGKMVQRKDAATSTQVFKYMFYLPSCIDYREYVATEKDAKLLRDDAGKTIANRLGVDYWDLKQANKRNPFEPPRKGQVIRYKVVDFDKGAIVNERQVLEFRGLEAKEIVQERTKKQIQEGLPQVLWSSDIFIYEYTPGEEHVQPDRLLNTSDISSELTTEPQTTPIEMSDIEKIRIKFSDLTKAEIKDRLDKRGVEYDGRNKKDELLEQLIDYEVEQLTENSENE